MRQMKQKPFKVTWEQWFRYGPDGDESDSTQKSVTLLTLEDAEQFKADLVSGKYRGLYDRTVNECEVTITQEQDDVEKVDM